MSMCTCVYEYVSMCVWLVFVCGMCDVWVYVVCMYMYGVCVVYVYVYVCLCVSEGICGVYVVCISKCLLCK